MSDDMENGLIENDDGIYEIDGIIASLPMLSSVTENGTIFEAIIRRQRKGFASNQVVRFEQDYYSDFNNNIGKPVKAHVVRVPDQNETGFNVLQVMEMEMLT